jgi:WD40 repeat protein
MDGVALIVTALAAGAASASHDDADYEVRACYARLRDHVDRCFARDPAGKAALAEYEAAPRAWGAALAARLSAAGAERDADLVDTAQALLALLGKAGPLPGNYLVTMHDAQGVQVGDHNTQANNQFVWHVENLNLPAGTYGKSAAVGPPPPPAREAPTWAVPRIDELERVVEAVCRRPGGAVGITTTGLEGAGGFGKTTLAEMVCADQRVRRHFAGRIYVVTIGRDVRESSAIAMKVVEAIRFITGHTTTYTNPGMAGDELGRLLDQHPGRRTLLVLDDVWEPAQLGPFLRGGKQCVRLVTTRAPGVLPDDAIRVRVDQMTEPQARAVLGWRLPPLPEQLARDLITATGRWPLLLRLTNRRIARQREAGADIAAAAEHVLALLRKRGPAAMDPSGPPPDPADPALRSALVRATVQAATDLLSGEERQRLNELGIFAANEPIPVLVAARLWQATSGLSEQQSRDLCVELSSLSLLTVTPDGGGFLTLHNVIRDYLCHELGDDQVTELNTGLVDAIESGLSRAEPLVPSAPSPQADWWALAEHAGSTSGDSYLADHAISHLLAAGRTEQAEAVAGDLRWVEARLRQHGPAAPWSDCTRIPTATAARRARDLAQAAHLLAPIDPAHALVDVLHSRLGSLPGWDEQVAARRPKLNQPALGDAPQAGLAPNQSHPLRLVNRCRPPDLPDPALQRVIKASTGPVRGLVVAPDGGWLAVIGLEAIQIWETSGWTERAALPSHRNGTQLVTSPAGDWAATVGEDGTARIWDTATWTEQATLTLGAKSGEVEAVPAPGGTWLAVAAGEKVRIWAAPGWTTAATLSAPAGRVRLVAAADGSWLLAFGTSGSTARVWRTDTWQERADLIVPWVNILAAAPDSRWLAAPGRDLALRIWDTASWQELAALPGPGGRVPYTAVAAPDGSWLATVHAGDAIVRVFDTATWEQRSAIAIHEYVAPIARAGAGRLAVAAQCGIVQIWDAATGQEQAVDTPSGIWVSAMEMSPRADWLATAESDGTVRIWDIDRARRLNGLPSPRPFGIGTMQVAPDASWLATMDIDTRRVRIWDAATGRERATPVACAEEHRVMMAPDSSWLAFRDSSGAQLVHVWEAATGRQQVVLNVAYGVASAELAPGGHWLVVVDGMGRVRLWDVPDGRERLCLPGPLEPWIEVSPDGGWLATRDERRRTIRLWDSVTGEQRAVLPDRRHGICDMAADGSWLATSGLDGTVRIWDTATGQERARLTGRSRQLRSFRSPDGSWLATSGPDDEELLIWDTATWEKQAAVRTRKGSDLILMAPDSSWIAIEGDDHKSLRIIETPTGQERAVIGTQQRGPAVIAPNSSWLAIAEGSKVRLWDATTGQEREVDTGQGPEVGAVAAPDGAWLATIGHFGGNTVRLWAPATGEAQVTMRVDDEVKECAWLGSTGLALRGHAGLYLFDLLRS